MSKQTKYFVYICALLPLLFLGNTGTVLAIEIESSSQTLTTETMNETSASNAGSPHPADKKQWRIMKLGVTLRQSRVRNL